MIKTKYVDVTVQHRIKVAYSDHVWNEDLAVDAVHETMKTVVENTYVNRPQDGILVNTVDSRIVVKEI